MVVSEHRRVITGNVNITHKDPGPVKIFIGFIIIVLLAVWFFSGMLTGLMTSAYCATREGCNEAEFCAGGLQSGTYFLFQLLSGLFWVVGSFAIALWTGIVWLIGDVVSAIKKVAANKQAKDEVSQAVANQIAVDSLSPETSGPAIDGADPIPGIINILQEKADADKVVSMYKLILERLDVLEEKAGIEKPVEPVEPTLELVMQQLAALEEQMKSSVKAENPRKS